MSSFKYGVFYICKKYSLEEYNLFKFLQYVFRKFTNIENKNWIIKLYYKNCK